MDILSELSGIPAQLKTLAADIDAAGPELEKVLKFVDQLAQAGKAFGVFAGPYSGEVTSISGMVDTIDQSVIAALDAHNTSVAAGTDTTQSQTALVANIAQVVAKSGAIKNTDTAAQVSAIATQVQTLTNAPAIGIKG